MRCNQVTGANGGRLICGFETSGIKPMPIGDRINIKDLLYKPHIFYEYKTVDKEKEKHIVKHDRLNLDYLINNGTQSISLLAQYIVDNKGVNRLTLVKCFKCSGKYKIVYGDESLYIFNGEIY